MALEPKRVLDDLIHLLLNNTALAPEALASTSNLKVRCSQGRSTAEDRLCSTKSTLAASYERKDRGLVLFSTGSNHNREVLPKTEIIASHV